jgi:hypothetical protein
MEGCQMTTEKAFSTERALDLALEALEKLWLLGDQAGAIANPAITAIKQARALDKMAENARALGLDYEPVQDVSLIDEGKTAAQPAPVQEPDRGDELTIAYMSGLHDGKKKREWVGLTDEEADNFLKAVWGREVTPKHFIQAIEAKLKEKNT